MHAFVCILKQRGQEFTLEVTSIVSQVFSLSTHCQSVTVLLYTYHRVCNCRLCRSKVRCVPGSAFLSLPGLCKKGNSPDSMEFWISYCGIRILLVKFMELWSRARVFSQWPLHTLTHLFQLRNRRLCRWSDMYNTCGITLWSHAVNHTLFESAYKLWSNMYVTLFFKNIMEFYGLCLSTYVRICYCMLLYSTDHIYCGFVLVFSYVRSCEHFVFQISKTVCQRLSTHAHITRIGLFSYVLYLPLFIWNTFRL